MLHELRLLQSFVLGACGRQLLQLTIRRPASAGLSSRTMRAMARLGEFPFALAFAFAVAVAGGMAAACSLAACHRSAEIVDETAPRAKLAAYRTASLRVSAEGLSADKRADLTQELEMRLSDSKLFVRVWGPDARADVVIRVTLVRLVEDGPAEVAFRVELADPQPPGALIARVEVTANSKTTGIAGGGGAANDFEDQTDTAIEKAVAAIAARLDRYAE
jgi:hypothetical protein